MCSEFIRDLTPSQNKESYQMAISKEGGPIAMLERREDLELGKRYDLIQIFSSKGVFINEILVNKVCQ